MKRLIKKAEALASEIQTLIEVDMTSRPERSSLLSSLELAHQVPDALRAADAGQGYYAVVAWFDEEQIESHTNEGISEVTVDVFWHNHLDLITSEIGDYTGPILHGVANPAILVPRDRS